MLKFLILFYAFMHTQSDARSIKQLNDGLRTILFNETIPSSIFRQSGFGGSWISNDEFIYQSNRDTIKFNVAANESSVLIPSTFLEGFSGASLTLSPDQSKVLIKYEQRSIFRHSTVAKFAVAFMDNLTDVYNISNGTEIQLCKFSSAGNGLIYIKDNTIYYATDIQIRNGVSTEKSPVGENGVQYYGIPDWVYEEEVLGSDAAAWFSPDGKYLAYIHFDDSKVEEFMYEMYGNGEDEYQYPKEIKLRYPKVGSDNPTVQLYVEDLTMGGLDLFMPPYPPNVDKDHIIATVFWINDSQLGAIWLNRRQNYGVFVVYSGSNWNEMEEIMVIDEPNGWIEADALIPTCESDGICYFVGNHDNWPTLTQVNINTKDVKHLTRNKHVFYYIGTRDNKIYYLATPSSLESFNRHLYTYSNDEERCITCDINTPEGNKCASVSASFSKDLSYYSLTCNGPDPSFTKIYNTDTNAVVYDWQKNTEIRDQIKEYSLPQKKILQVPVDNGKFNAAVMMLLPQEVNFDDPNNAAQTYPMLVRVYGGPGSVRVANTFSIGFQSYQVTTKKMIYVEIDGRGTGQKGVDMMFSINNKLGTYEMEDQIAVTKHLIETYKFIDRQRVGIWGWSYGGYATAMTLAKDTGKVFKCGVSVAPVTNWIFYDTIYTERYMGSDPYAQHYNDSDVSTEKHIEGIAMHDFLLIHGNADDNVHYQQSMVLAKALEIADVMFDQVSYPDEAHSLSGVSRHLYHKLDNFWNECFDLE